MKISIKNPCEANWDEMKGDEKKRFCLQCQKHVFYLSAMTTKQAEQVLSQAEEPCIRYAVDADNQVHFRKRRGGSWLLAVSMLAFGCDVSFQQDSVSQPISQQQRITDETRPSVLSVIWQRLQKRITKQPETKTVVTMGAIRKTPVSMGRVAR